MAIEEAAGRARASLAAVRLQVPRCVAHLPPTPGLIKTNLLVACIVSTAPVLALLAPQAVAACAPTTQLQVLRMVGVGWVAAPGVVAHAVAPGTVQVATPPLRLEGAVAERQLPTQDPASVEAPRPERCLVRVPRQDGPLARTQLPQLEVVLPTTASATRARLPLLRDYPSGRLLLYLLCHLHPLVYLRWSLR